MKKQLTKEELAEKKKGRKAGIIAILLILIAAPIIWFSMEYFATESIITYEHVKIQEDSLCVILSEKTSSDHTTLSDHKNHIENDGKDSHYGYFLEVYDSISGKSIDKIKFKSPVWTIQETPELFVFPDGTIWVISTCRYSIQDEHGFMLKFKFENQKITQKEFVLDEKYEIRNIHENFVLISEGYDLSGDYWDILNGNLYFDLETEQIVDTRKSKK